MAVSIHPTAVVDPGAELGRDVWVGPFAYIGPNTQVGDRCRIGPQAQVMGPSEIGADNVIHGQASVGTDPQDKKFEGEETWLIVGARNHFREYTTINRGTGFGGGRTTIGADNLFLTGAHVAHDCVIGDQTVFINNATAGGHCVVEDWATLGAFSSMHPFCRLGQHAYVGGYTIVTMDALPFATTVGQKPQCYGVNRIGLERRGFDGAQIRSLQRAFRVLLRSSLNTTQAVEALERDHAGDPSVEVLLEFIRSSERGVIKAGRRGARGAG